MSASIHGSGLTRLLGLGPEKTSSTRKTSEFTASLRTGLIVFRYKFWGAEIAGNPPSVHYDEIMSDDKGVGSWTDKIVRDDKIPLAFY